MPQAMLTNTAAATNQSWYPNSGASFHVTGNSQNIHQTTSFEGPDQIYIGNGQGLAIKTSGSTSSPSPLNPNIPLVLHKLLHVLSITKNPISVSKFAKDNSVYFEFHADHCLVKLQASHEVLLKGKVGPDGLYEFPHLLQPAAECLPSVSSSKFPQINSTISDLNVNNSVPFSTITWHNRLGHPDFNTLETELNHCNIPVSNKFAIDFCSACSVGKSHRLPSHTSTFTYIAPLELVYSDLWGPAPMHSANNYLYYISFVDAYSRFTWIYLLKSKAEALSGFQTIQSHGRTAI